MNQREQQRMYTRRKIYECGIQLFMEKSYDTVKITDIVKMAQVSVGAFYYHFKSKENLIDEGYRQFDKKLKKAWEIDKPKPGVETVEYLIFGQLSDVAQKGVEVTEIFFKNQLGNTNTYLFEKDRFLYKKMCENIDLVNDSEVSNEVIVDGILRVSRGTIYDWCLHNGKFDIIEIGIKEVRIQLEHYRII